MDDNLLSDGAYEAHVTERLKRLLKDMAVVLAVFVVTGSLFFLLL